jgi:hypothetical protein
LTVAEMLGHRNPMVTLNVYGHALEESKREATDVIVRVLGASARRGHAATLTAGDSSTLEDLREQLVNLGLNTTEIDARIEVEKEAARGPRPRRTPRIASSS